MEQADPQSIALAVTLGGALIFGAFRLFSNFSAPVAITKDSKATNAKDSSQKPKKAKKNEKKKPKKEVSPPPEPKAVAIPTKPSQPSVKTPAAEVTSQKKKTQEANVKQKEKVSEPVEEVQPTPVVASKKKKNKKKKAKAPRPDVEDDSSSSEDEEIRAKQTKIPQKATPAPVPVPVKAPVQQVFEEFEETDGWETVKVRKPKQTVSSTVADVKALTGSSTGAVSSVETGKGKKNKKEFKQTIEIGEFANVVLGEGGSTVSNIEQVSGARVTVNRDRSTCLVTGEEEAVAVATQMIQSLVSNQARIEMTLSSRLDKAIISKPDTKQKIRTLSGAKLDFKSGTAPSDPLIVVITGETEQVNTAEQLVKDYLAGKTPDGNDGIKRIQVSNFQAKIVIGPRGETISALQKETGANINVEFIPDPSASGSDKGEESAVVTVIGSSEQIQSGTLAIQKFLAEHNYSTTIPLNSEARPGVLLRLNDLRRDIDNLNVELTEDRSSIMLQGSETGVKEGRSRVVRWIDDELGPPKISTGEVLNTLDLGGAAGKVIGRNRTMLNQLLKSNPGAKVEIKQGTTCYVYGQPNSVKKLFTDIEDIISKHEEVIAKTKQEEEELQNASWIVAGVQKDETGTNYAPESDWGGFKLAQFQGW